VPSVAAAAALIKIRRRHSAISIDPLQHTSSTVQELQVFENRSQREQSRQKAGLPTALLIELRLRTWNANESGTAKEFMW